MADRGKKCLILSYSKLLKFQIECIARKFNLNIENIEIKTYLKWFIDELKRFDYNPKEFEKKLFIYDLDKVENALSNIPEEEKLRYDYIFIDEAQDVQDGLIKYFGQFCEKIFITFDDCQKIGNEESKLIYEHSNILVDLDIGDRFFDLIDNYRNTIQIENVAKLLLTSYNTNDLTLKKVTATRQGAKAKLLYSKNELSYIKVAKYVVEHYDMSKSVAVLFDSTGGSEEVFNTLKTSLLNEIKLYAPKIKLLFKYSGSNNKRYNNINEKNALDNGIFLMSYKVSKGLEFDDVYVLTAGAKIDNYQKRNALYVACTRAKSMTHIIIDNENTVLNKLFWDHSYMFDTYNIDALE